jgi:hypothetical protein
VDAWAGRRGVAAVGLTDTPPLGRNRGWGIRAKGVVYESGQTPGVFPRIVDHRYLGVMEIPLLAGQHFTQFDNEQIGERRHSERDQMPNYSTLTIIVRSSSRCERSPPVYGRRCANLMRRCRWGIFTRSNP